MNIFITGGSSGIGKSITERLCKRHGVIICGRNIDNLIDVAKNTYVLYDRCDVSDEEDIINSFNRIRNVVESLDVIINCAGSFGEIGRIDKTDSKKWIHTIETNLFGTYFVTKHFLPLLLRSKTRKIINFAGGGAFGTFPNFSAYAVSKSGVVRLTENIADELEHLGITANCVAPGFIATPIHNETLKAGRDKAGDQYDKVIENMSEVDVDVALRRVVDCVEFLISSESNGLTGKTISVGFDKWDTEEFKNRIPDINKSDLYTMRRINP